MGRARLGRSRLLPLAVAVAAVAVTMALAACDAGRDGAVSAPRTPQRGGTVVYALPPSTTANYIFPFMNAQVISIANENYLQFLMYRPLYWFGQGTEPVLNAGLSLAQPPRYSGRTVTITLKNYKWSDGQPVTTKDLMFWINMMRADAVTDWGAYVPGGFPANVTSFKIISPFVLRMVMQKAYSPIWFTYNELSQITPIPQAWDRTVAGPSDCARDVADCDAVYQYLNSQAKDVSGWAASPLWGTVDGPWRLQSASAVGQNVFVPNPSYSGPVKPSLDKFIEQPFTSETAEYNTLLAGRGERIDVGYLPTVDAPPRPPGQATGPNPVPGYTLDPLYPWGIEYFPLNFQNDTGQAPIFRQVYFRQALQELTNQAGVIDGPLHGYGQATVGPVGAVPASVFLSPKGRQGDSFPYNPKRAAQLLSSHGWTVTPGGISTCRAGPRCGPGIGDGARLKFELIYAAGIDWLESDLKQLRSNAAKVGIQIGLRAEPFNSVTASVANCKVIAAVSCGWQMGDWGSGWTFAPDYYPTGETLFGSGSAANAGGYSDPANGAMIQQTLTNSSLGLLYNWQDYLSEQVPVIWQPLAVYELTEIAKNLRGVTPQSPMLTINPENWYFVTSTARPGPA
jgi:peptide/nickel transport system substrate-binding protein